MARTLTINLDDRDAHYVRLALMDLEYVLFVKSGDSADDMARWKQVRDLMARIGRAVGRQQADSLTLGSVR